MKKHKNQQEKMSLKKIQSAPPPLFAREAKLGGFASPFHCFALCADVRTSAKALSLHAHPLAAANNSSRESESGPLWAGAIMQVRMLWCHRTGQRKHMATAGHTLKARS